MRVTLKSLVFDVKFSTDFFFLGFLPSGVCCLHQRERALHSHPQDDGRGEGVRNYRTRSEHKTKSIHLLFLPFQLLNCLQPFTVDIVFDWFIDVPVVSAFPSCRRSLH